MKFIKIGRQTLNVEHIVAYTLHGNAEHTQLRISTLAGDVDVDKLHAMEVHAAIELAINPDNLLPGRENQQLLDPPAPRA